MKNAFIVFAMTMILVSCSSTKPTSTADSNSDLEKRMTAKLGTATKEELITEFGNAEWCKEENTTGGETCRFYLKKGTRWIGKDRFKKSVEQFDEVTAHFDGSGIFRSFKSKSLR